MAKKSKPGKSTAPPPQAEPAAAADDGELRTSSESENDAGDDGDAGDGEAGPPILAPTDDSAELLVVIWKGAITKAQAASFGVEYEGTTLREMVRLLPAHEAAEWASANRGRVYRLGEQVDTGVEHDQGDEEDEAASG